MDTDTSSVHGHRNARSTKDTSDDPSCDDIQSTNTKEVNDRSDGGVNKTAEFSDIATTGNMYLVLDKDSGQLVVSEERNRDNEIITEGVSAISKDANDFVRYDALRCDDVQSSDSKVNETPTDTSNTAYLVFDEKTSQYFISETPADTACKDKKDDEIVTPDFEPTKSTVQQAINRATSVMETKDPRVWEEPDCLQDDMLMEPPVPDFPPYKLSRLISLANQTPVDNAANVCANARSNRINATITNVSMESLQQQRLTGPTDQQVSSFLDNEGKQNIVRESIVGQDGSSVTNLPESAQQPVALPSVLSQLTANTNIIPEFLSDPDMTPYDVQYHKKFERLRQLRVQNAQAEEILKQDKSLQHLPMAKTSNCASDSVQTMGSSGNSTSTLNELVSDALSACNDFIICEICQGFVSDRETLRLHLFTAHDVSISDEAFDANTPSLWCSGCQGQFWSEQGLNVHMPICQPTIIAPAPTPPIAHTSLKKTVTDHKCFICNRPVIRFLDHMKSVHGLTSEDFVMPLNKRKCVACGLIFRFRDLAPHMSFQHGLKLMKFQKPLSFPMKTGTLSPRRHYTECQVPPKITMDDSLPRHKLYTQCQVCKYLMKTKVYQDHLERKHLKMCHVDLKRLPREEIEQYARVKYHTRRSKKLL